MAVSVLIVEDDRNIAELLQMYLEKEGYAVTVARQVHEVQLLIYAEVIHVDGLAGGGAYPGEIFAVQQTVYH